MEEADKKVYYDLNNGHLIKSIIWIYPQFVCPLFRSFIYNIFLQQMIFGDENARTLASSNPIRSQSNIKTETSNLLKSENRTNLKPDIRTDLKPDNRTKISSEVPVDVKTKNVPFSKTDEIPQAIKDRLSNSYKKTQSSVEDFCEEKNIFNEKSKQIDDDLHKRVKFESEGKKKKKTAKSYEAKKESALEFVRKLRKDSHKNAQSSTVVSKTREQEISQIGLSLTRRISDVAINTRYGKKLCQPPSNSTSATIYLSVFPSKNVK